MRGGRNGENAKMRKGKIERGGREKGGRQEGEKRTGREKRRDKKFVPVPTVQNWLLSHKKAMFRMAIGSTVERKGEIIKRKETEKRIEQGRNEKKKENSGERDEKMDHKGNDEFQLHALNPRVSVMYLPPQWRLLHFLLLF